MRNIAFACFFTIFCFSVNVSAEPRSGIHDPKINHHQREEHRRIAQGVASGELTGAEVKDIHQDKLQIRQQEQIDKADGQLTRNERRNLRSQQRGLSKEIHDEKHNEDTRGSVAQ
jgi:hypothetical protein